MEKKRAKRNKEYISLSDCAGCGDELFMTKETIIHRKVEGKHLQFHPWCWPKYRGSKETTKGVIS